MTNSINSAMSATKPMRMRKRLGSTTYEVSVHYSKTSNETVDEKISRLIRNEVAQRKAVGE